ncbi:MAG: hypothetical protein Q8N80_00040, partial [Candidatus Omnitrophota bacterium]|nr:hypothetical protein [Candidatus Omnitrophota bacterium]
NWLRCDLSPEELDKKYRSIVFYKSQTHSSAFYLFYFARKNEIFSDYPEVEIKPQSTLEGKDIVYSDASVLFKEAEYPIDLKQAETIEDKGSVSYAVADNYFVVRLDKPKKLSSRFGVMLYIFGYSQSTPFARMPKIRIITMGNKCKVFSSKDRVINSGVLLDFKRSSLILKIPLKLLGQPDYALTALKAYHGNLPIDVVAFRKVKIK